MTDTVLLEKKELREQMAGRVEVLDKVKELFLMPKLDMLTTQQVAEYYEVDYEAIKTCYMRNKNEIDGDGAPLNKVSELKLQVATLAKSNHGVTFDLGNGITMEVPNRGIRMFSKRAILRIGMLLRDSKIAQEVRTQLLNAFEHTEDAIKVADLDDEKEMLYNIGLAVSGGDAVKVAQAASIYIGFKNRHIDQLKKDNQALAAEILEWSDRSSVNKAVRTIAQRLNRQYGLVWKWLYDELRYKHGMGLSQRGPGPAIQYVKDNEWAKVQESLCAICEYNGLSPSKIMQACKMMD